MAQASRGVGRRGAERSVDRDRHGRGQRAAITGPYLPPLNTRIDVFESAVASTAEYLKELWPDELDDVSFEVAAIPAEEDPSSGMERWHASAAERRVVLFRLPIERLAKPGRDGDLDRRMLVESCVFRAVAELLGKDPWDLAPDRYRHL